MRVLVLGGTGVIGAAVVRALIAAGHTVSGLARSPDAAERLLETGAEPVAGDIGAPRLWAGAVIDEVDTVVLAAGSFTTDMGAVEARLLDTLLPALASTGRRPTLVYTGGCWLWGPSPERAIDERTGFDPLPAFAWAVGHVERVLAAPGIRAAVVHPAMVHADAAGPVAAMEAQARAGEPVRLIGSATTLWPMVHADDLADLYRRVLEDETFTGHVIGVADEAVAVGDLAHAAAQRHGSTLPPRVVAENLVVTELGDWARGYARSQRMSGAFARSRLGWKPRRSARPAASFAGR